VEFLFEPVGCLVVLLRVSKFVGEIRDRESEAEPSLPEPGERQSHGAVLLLIIFLYDIIVQSTVLCFDGVLLVYFN
jgi:hypothetical protein